MTAGKRRPAGVLARSLKPGSAVRSALQPGLQALGTYSTRVNDRERRVTDSIDFDRATRPDASQESRWDYFLGVADTRDGVIMGVEVHPASAKEVKAVIDKKTASSRLVQQELEAGVRVTRWVWIASGKTTVFKLSKNSRYYRALAKHRIELVGKQLVL